MLIDAKDAKDFFKGYKPLLAKALEVLPEDASDWLDGRNALLDGEFWHDVAESAEEKEVADALDQVMEGHIIWLKDFQDHSAIYHEESDQFLAAFALESDFSEILKPYVPIDACLLPFRGKIVADGIFSEPREPLTKNAAEELEQKYWKVRKAGKLIWQFPKPRRRAPAKAKTPPKTTASGSISLPAPTAKQAEYLSFIYHYMDMSGISPSEGDMQKFFEVAAPTVHQMVVRLEEKGFIFRKQGVARSIVLHPAIVAAMEDADGPEQTKGPLLLYTFKVEVEDYVGEVFMTGDWSLYDLAQTIIDCVDFMFDHPFEFLDNIESPYDSKKRYSLFADMDMPMNDDVPDPGVKKIMISQVFQEGTEMVFHFDYGDDWWMLITCTSIKEAKQVKRRARHVRELTGTPPVQYPPCEDDDWDEEE